MIIQIEITDQEENLIARLLKYSPTITKDIEVEDEETGETRLETVTVDAPYTKHQYITGAFIRRKDEFIDIALKDALAITAKQTEKTLADNIEAIKGAVLTHGIENLGTILKGML